MLFKRKDGRLVTGLDPFFKLIPHVMNKRTESQIFYKQDFSCDPLDAYIKQKREGGLQLSYMSVLLCAIMKTFSQRPYLNRFVINGRIYARKDIEMAFVVKKSLRDDTGETTAKLRFEGTENIDRFAEKINEALLLNQNEQESNSTDKLAARFMSLPNGLIKAAVAVIKCLDRHNMIPNSILEGSPFHVSIFFTNVKSIKLNYLYHHLYEFGTASFFISLGKVSYRMELNKQGNAENRKFITVGYTIDERICDGLYLSNSLKILEQYMKNPALMEDTLVRVLEKNVK